MYKALTNFVIFKTDALFNSKATFKGVNGMDIVINHDFDPQKHARIYGEVVSVPQRLSHFPIMQENAGLPAYHEYSPFIYKYLDDIAMEVEIGDKIYFHFNTMITKGNIIGEEGKHPNKTWFVKVRYDQIICAVRGDKIIPIGSYTLVKPDLESWDDISIPTYSEVLGDDGKPMLKPKEQWLITKTAPEARYLSGFVEHIGTPLHGDNLEMKDGDKIIYRRNADWNQSIEGKQYFSIRQRHCLGRFVNAD